MPQDGIGVYLVRNGASKVTKQMRLFKNKEVAQRRTFQISIWKVLIVCLLLCIANAEALLARELKMDEAYTDRVILARDVSLSNLDMFKKQLEKNLPVGTSKSDVEKYLRQIGFPFDPSVPRMGCLFLDSRYDISPNSFKCIIERIGQTRLIFSTSVSIYIHLDENEKVKLISYRLQYL